MTAHNCNIADGDKKREEFRWSQPEPRTFASDDPRKRIFCNGRCLKPKDWRLSREHHRNLAFKWARATQVILEGLDKDQFTIFKGCFKAPNMTPTQWSLFKRAFGQYRRRFCVRNNVSIEIVAKQHITTNGGKTHPPDDMHFDFIGYTDVELSERKFRELILNWVKSSGGKRIMSSVVFVSDRSPQNLERLTNYCLKYADTQTDEYDSFMRSFPLPATSFATTWVSDGFWQRSVLTVEMSREWNGELETKTVKQSPMDQVWHEWITIAFGSGTPKFTTFDYRVGQKLGAIIGAAQDVYPIRGNVSLASTTALESGENSVNYSLYRNSRSETSYTEVLSRNAAVNFDAWGIRPISDNEAIVGNGHVQLVVPKSDLPHIIQKMTPEPLQKTIISPENDGRFEFLRWDSDSKIESIINPTGNAWARDELTPKDQQFLYELEVIEDFVH